MISEIHWGIRLQPVLVSSNRVSSEVGDGLEAAVSDGVLNDSAYLGGRHSPLTISMAALRAFGGSPHASMFGVETCGEGSIGDISVDVNANVYFDHCVRRYWSLVVWGEV